MSAKDILRHGLNSSRSMTLKLLADFSDAELLVRICPAANHIAWQLGHLAEAECYFQGLLSPDPYPLPEGFAAKHAKDKSGNDDPAGFCTKDEYIQIMGDQRAKSVALLEAMSDDQLERLIEPPNNFAKDVEQVFFLIGSHEVMHQGQITAVRRILGKKVVF